MLLWTTQTRATCNASTITRKDIAIRFSTDQAPPHPGEILRERFLKPRGLTQTELAERLRMSYVRLNEIVNGRRGITPDTALRFGRLFDTPPEYWLHAQMACDLYEAQQKIGAEIEEIMPL